MYFKKLKFILNLIKSEIKQRIYFRKILALFLVPIGLLSSLINLELGFRLLIKIFVTELVCFDPIVASRIKKLIPTVINRYYKGIPEFGIRNNHRNLEADFLVIKKYISQREKGVISIHWRWQIDIFSRNYNLEKILDKYIILLGADCYGAEFTLPFLSLMYKGKICNGIVFVAVKNSNTKRRLNLLGFDTIPYGISSDYIDDTLFNVIPSIKKDIDIIMIANWNISVKRQYVLFSALKKIKNPMNVVLVGFSGSKNSISDVIFLEQFYNINQHRIYYYEDISQEKINVLLNRSKLSVITSLMEGGNRACFESFFSNVPVIILKENIGIPKEYFNSETGLIASEKNLHSAIVQMLDDFYIYSPRNWSLKNIDPLTTQQNINLFLKDYSAKNNWDWTTDIEGKKWNNQSFKYLDNNIKSTFLNDFAFIKDAHISE